MIVNKNEKVYNVKENAKSWTITINIANIPVVYNIKKSDCPTFKMLKEFMDKNNIF